MKRILPFLFAIIFSSTTFAEWARVGENTAGNIFYVDFQKVQKIDGYIYFLLLNNYGTQSEWGYMSSISYVQGDCRLFRYKNLSWSIYKQPMGSGDSPVPIKPPDEWIYPSAKQSNELILEIMCKHLN